MKAGKITLYANTKHGLGYSTIESISRLMRLCKSMFDAENELDELLCSYVNFSAHTVDELVDAMLLRLNDMLDLAKRDDSSLPEGSYSRIMIEVNDVELEAEKINFTDDPHAEHIHIFNRKGKGFIRVKHSDILSLVTKSIETLEKVRNEQL